MPKVWAGAYSYAEKSFIFQLNDTNWHQFTWYQHGNSGGTATLKDASGTVIDRRTFKESDFTNGLYVTYMVRDDFTLVLSGEIVSYGIEGVFFDTPLSETPSDLTFEPVSGRQAKLKWTNETAYDVVVERSGDVVHFEQVADLPNGTNQYIDSPLEAGTAYFYRIRYRDGNRYSRASAAFVIATADYLDTTLSLVTGHDVEVGVDGYVAFSTVLKDASGTAMPGRPVSFSLEGPYVGTTINGDLGTVITDANGVATLNYHASYGGSFVVSASLPYDDTDQINRSMARIPLYVYNTPSSPPVVIRTSEAVKPGDIFSLFGDGLNSDDTVVTLANGTPLNIVQGDPEGRFLTVELPEIDQRRYCSIAGNQSLWGFFCCSQSARSALAGRFDRVCGHEGRPVWTEYGCCRICRDSGDADKARKCGQRRGNHQRSRRSKSVRRAI